MLHKFAASILIAIGFLTSRAADPDIRIAFAPFTTDDHSYRSWQGVADLSDRVVAELHALPGVTWVERIDLKRLEDERILASAGLAAPTPETRLEPADWSLSVHFDEASGARRPWRITVLDLRLGRVLAATNLVLEVAERSRIDADSALTTVVVEEVRKAVGFAMGRRAATSGLRRALWLDLDPPSTPEGWDFIRPLASEDAVNEAELAAAGWTRGFGPEGWRDVELVAWPQTNAVRLPNRAMVRIWSKGRLHVLPLESVGAWHDLSASTAGAAMGLDEAIRSAADNLEGLGAADFVSVSDFSRPEDWARWRHGFQRISLAHRLAPERPRTRRTLAAARFPRQALRDARHPLRWGYRMRETWGAFVEKHGLGEPESDAFVTGAEDPEFGDSPDTVAANYLFSATIAVRQHEYAFGHGAAASFPADIDSRALERIRARDVAELRERLTRTLGTPGLEGLRTQAILEVLTYGAGMDSKGWSEWFDRYADRLPSRTTPDLVRHPKELRWQLEKIYTLAGRPGDEAQPYRKLTDDRSGTPSTETRPQIVPLALPRVSQLNSLSVGPALDGGDLELGPSMVPEALQPIDFGEEVRPASMAWGSQGEAWLWGFRSERDSSGQGDDPERRRPESIRPVGLLFRSRDGKPFQPIERTLLTEGIQQLVGHQGEVWGSNSSNVWRIPRNRDVPEAASTGLNGFARLVSTGDRLLAFSGAVYQWRSESNRWETLVPPERFPSHAGRIAVAVHGDALWLRPHGSMSLPEGGSNPRRYPWLRWEGSRWQPTVWPEAEEIRFDREGTAWCAFDGRLRALSANGSDLWVGNVPANPVVWRDPESIAAFREPIPPPLAASSSRFGVPSIDPDYRVEFRSSELEPLMRVLRNVTAVGTAEGTRFAHRIDDPVLGVALDGDRLWVASLRRTHRQGPHSRVTLLHAPTRRWIASVDLPDRLEDWSVGPDGLLVRTGPDGGTTKRKSPLLRIDAAVLLKVPESRWLPADPTPAELRFALSRLGPRQRAVRAWMQGDPTPLRNLLREVDMPVAPAEDLFLVSVTSANEADRRKALEVLRRDHAGSLFTAAIQQEAKPAP
jgi:hypothetical protein